MLTSAGFDIVMRLRSSIVSIERKLFLSFSSEYKPITTDLLFLLELILCTWPL